MNSAYFGKKGYTIPKEHLSLIEQNMIRDELTVSPNISLNMGGPKIQFPIYRESPKKFYLPKHYGIQKFGMPTENHNDNGFPISVEFVGTLRDYQIQIVNTYMKNIQNGNFGGLLEIGCGQGKTIMALNILSKIKMKTLVIVHKEFLMNQWIERISQFLPNARVGKIQGQTIDIENKDIVLGMLQSLSMKTYPEDTFSSFGFTIVDETHHIGAEVFVRSLFQVTTKYMLGLSATMTRKDGLTKVFKLFIGDIVYKHIDNQQHNVLVNVYTFTTPDKDFNDIILNFQGQPQYSSMISKISNFGPRSDFIIQILKHTLENNPNQQIIILTNNKSMLNYLYDAIIYNNIAEASVGYYIGGMKENELKKSEEYKIILATYAMAAEALDIKTLTTLIMASPKTDVTQSIGRILRTKHTQPTVIDIADTHDVFQNQLKKRITYYKKQNYTVNIYDNNSLSSYKNLNYIPKKATKPVCLIDTRGTPLYKGIIPV
tara:strand:- start:655 stop:2115 length:1461 start_codon:yes stop_codon:yes gene_type:complete